MKTCRSTLNQNTKYLNDNINIKNKQYFQDIYDLIIKNRTIKDKTQSSTIDIGCAAGDFLHFLKLKEFPDALFGVDIFSELLDRALQKVPDATFIQKSILELPNTFDYSFDTVIASGVLTLFELEHIYSFFKNIRRLLRNDGTAIIFSPFNQYGVDIHVSHRARVTSKPLQWETGYNCFSFQTIEEITLPLFRSIKFIPFSLNISVKRSCNATYSWTMKNEYKERQEVNGLNLMLDRYFLILNA